MILKALYDYYQRCDGLAPFGMEYKEIGFVIVVSKYGDFLRFEDNRKDKASATSFLVKKHVSRTAGIAPNYLYDNSSYVFGYSKASTDKDAKKDLDCFSAFAEKVKGICERFPECGELNALKLFYNKPRDLILAQLKQDPLWEEVEKNLSKKFSNFSFRIDGDTELIAEKQEILQLSEDNDKKKSKKATCLITGQKGVPVETTTSTMIPGSQATAKLVAFQVNSGYDSYGKSKCFNAPISAKAEFAYTTALNRLLASGSRNKFMIGSRTYVFWASSDSDAAKGVEDGLFDMFSFADSTDSTDPNEGIEKVRAVFDAVYTGKIRTGLADKFYILGLEPNSARIAVVFWQETPLKEFAANILHHFCDMDMGKTKRPYYGLRDMLGAVTLSKKHTDATPNLPDAVIKSVFQGTPYPYTLFSSVIRRIRAERDVAFYGGPCRLAIIKAYLNRINDNNKKIEIMLDKENTNLGYLCGRLFAVLEKIQEDANSTNTVRDRYMNAASATPAAVFPTILNLSLHHAQKLSQGGEVWFEKIKQEIIGKMPAGGFPAHLGLQDQGRFFVGYYHQRQDFFKKKEDKEEKMIN